MTNQAKQMYALDLDQCMELIKAVGNSRTVLLQGDMGTGKSSMLYEIAKQTGFKPIYFDCTTKDLGDMMIPSLQSIEEDGCVRMIPNEELGVHLDEPVFFQRSQSSVHNHTDSGGTVRNFGILRIILDRLQTRQLICQFDKRHEIHRTPITNRTHQRSGQCLIVERFPLFENVRCRVKRSWCNKRCSLLLRMKDVWVLVWVFHVLERCHQLWIVFDPTK